MPKRRRYAMDRKALLGKALLEVLAEFAVFAALLFLCAGTLLWPAGWVFMALFFGFALAIVLWVARKEPELLEERMSSPMQSSSSGQPLWEKGLWARLWCSSLAG